MQKQDSFHGYKALNEVAHLRIPGRRNDLRTQAETVHSDGSQTGRNI